MQFFSLRGLIPAHFQKKNAIYVKKIVFLQNENKSHILIMKYKVLFLALMLAGLACQAQNVMDSQGRKQGHWVKTDKHGTKIYEGDFVNDLETGTFTYFYPNGSVRIRNEFTVPGKVCHHQIFDAKGQLIAKGDLNQKNRHGRWEFFSAGGQMLRFTNYKMGVKEGLEVIFTSKGDTAEVCTWTDNHRNGRWWKRIGLNGWITATYVMGGIEGRLVEYNDAQELVREGHYTKGERNGHWKYYENKQLVVDETWRMGTLRDRQVRLLLPEERFVSIYDIYYMAPQGKQKTIVYLSNGNKLVDMEPSELLYAHVGDGRFSLANREARIMVATNLIVGTTFDSEGREILRLDPRPDFNVYPDEDCQKMLKSLQYQQQTIDGGGTFEFR